MKCYLIVTNYEGNTEFARFWADDEDHALEQLDLCCDEYNPSQYVTHIFVSDTEILNTTSERMWITDQVKDRIHDEHCERQDFLTNLKIGDEVKWNDPVTGSGVYTIVEISTESGALSGFEMEVLFLSDGHRSFMVYAREIE